LVSITPVDDEARGFDELPTNRLDKTDRKFLATAIVSGARIVNALDSDWCEQRNLLAMVGIDVVQLCPEHAVAGLSEFLCAKR
jgi:hypothetical protein